MTISIHDRAAIEQLRRSLKLDPQCLHQLRAALCRKQRSDDEALAKLPAEARAAFASEVELHALALDSRHDSQRDGATKLVFRTAQGLLLESVVLRPASGRTALCISTQIGCAAHCDFCATGKMSVARNLSTSEILDQLVQANQLLASEGRAVRNLVVMGMGEPFHNEDRLYAALDILADPACFNLNPKRMLVSTVGIPAAMVRCAARYPRLRLAVSLHSARQDVRERIMPIAQRHDLAELRAALVEVTRLQRQPVMIEYLLLACINDTPTDVAALVEYLRGVAVHINLIPYNPIADAPHLAGSSPERRATFSAVLKAAGFPVTTRYSLGADIAAACGQLVRQTHRRRVAAAPGG